MFIVPQKAYRVVRFAIVVATLVVLSGCDKREPNDYASATSAAYAMFNAFSYVSASPQSAWAFLGPDTQSRLQQLADQGPEGMHPMDYLRFGWLPSEALIKTMEPIEKSSTHTRFLIETELNDRFELEMVRVNDGWRVEIGGVDEEKKMQHQPVQDSEDQ